MHKIKILIIFNFFVLLVSAQSKSDTVSIVDRMVDTELLQAIFNNDFARMSKYLENNSEISVDHNQGEGLIEDTWRLSLYGDAWNMQMIVYQPNDNIEVSKLFIEFKTSFEANKFLRYFAPLAGFCCPGQDGRYFRKWQTAEIYEDDVNVVFFWLTYPPIKASEKAIEKYMK